MRNKLVKILGIFALMVMVAYQGAILRYSHIHIVNGTIITHIHGFNPGEEQTHTHTAQEFAKIDVLYHYISTTLISLLTISSLIVFLRFIFSNNIASFLYSELISTSLRGPPSCLLVK